MPTYEYRCPANGQIIEVIHPMSEKLRTWEELCRAAQMDLGETSPNSPVEKVIHAPGLAFPKTNAELKNLGFTKLVKREKGVYENVTATDGEKRYMKADDVNSMPNLKKKISD